MSNKLGFHLVTHLSVAPACLCIICTRTPFAKQISLWLFCCL